MMAHSHHVPHVDFSILLLYCQTFLQFERGKQSSQGREEGNFIINFVLAEPKLAQDKC